MADLRLKPDKDLLEDLIAQAEGLNEADYEAQSFAVMRTALVAAKDVFDKEDATQEEIDASAAALKDAIAQLTTTGSGEEPEQAWRQRYDRYGQCCTESGTDSGYCR